MSLSTEMNYEKRFSGGKTTIKIEDEDREFYAYFLTLSFSSVFSRYSLNVWLLGSNLSAS